MPHLPAEAREFLRCLLIPRGALLAVLAPLLVLLGLRSAECMGYRRPANSDVLLGCLAVLTAALYRPGSALQRLQRGLLELGLCMIACHFANTTTLVRAYAHYLLAPWFFACWVRPGQQSRTLRPLSMGVLAGLGLLLLVPPGSAGALDQTIWNAGEFSQSVREAFAPGVSAEMNSRVVLVYTFAQLLLYAV